MLWAKYPINQDADPPDKELGRAPRQPPARQGGSLFVHQLALNMAQDQGVHAGSPLSPPPPVSGRGVQAAPSSGGHRALTQSISHPKSSRSSHSCIRALSPAGPRPGSARATGPRQRAPRGRDSPSPEAGHRGGRAQSILVGSFLRCLASRRILARERRMGTAMGKKRGM